MATSDSGSVFFPPGVCRMKFGRGMPGMWQWLCVQSRTINQKSSSSLKWKQCPDPRWQFCFAGLCEQCVATGYLSASSWQGSGDGECHCKSTKRENKYRLVEMSYLWPQSCPPPQAQESRSAQWDFSGWTEIGVLSCSAALFSCLHRAFMLCHNKRGTKYNQRISVNFSPMGRDQETVGLLPHASFKDKIPSTDV